MKEGEGLQALLGCDNDYAGPTRIAGGVLEAACLADGGEESSLGKSSADAENLVLAGGTLRYAGAGATTDRQITLDGWGGIESWFGPLVFTHAGPLAFATPDTDQTLVLGGASGGANTFSFHITDNGAGRTSLTKDGIGTWILGNASNSYTGATRIERGVLAVEKLANGGEVSSIGASSSAAANLVLAGGTLRYTGAGDSTDRLFTLLPGSSAIEAAGTGAIRLTGEGSIALAGSGARTLTLDSGMHDGNLLAAAIGNGIGGVTSLVKRGAGQWILTGDNTFTGTIQIDAGTLTIGDGGTNGSIASSAVVMMNPAVLEFDRAGLVTYGGNISGYGSVSVKGGGTLVLSGTNNYSGGTVIGAGSTLKIDDGGSILGTVNMGMASAFVVNRSGTETLDVQLTGSGRLVLEGDGTTILDDYQYYTGGTAINGGTLQLALLNFLGSGAISFDGGTLRLLGSAYSARDVNLAGDGAFDISGASTDVAWEAVISGSGGLTKKGSGILRLLADNTYGGGTVVEAGALHVGTGANRGWITGDLVNDGAVHFNRSDDKVFDGLISGAGNLVKQGSGTLTLSADNSYKGMTEVAAGRLVINGDQSGATGTTFVKNNARLAGNGVVGGDVSVADGGRIAPGDPGSTGTLTINGKLELSDSSRLELHFGEANAVGGAYNDLLAVKGDLVLDGLLSFETPADGSFDPGVYRIISYDGALTNNGLNIAYPAGFDGILHLQTAHTGQINLVNSTGMGFSFWDPAFPLGDGVISGGSGTWYVGGTATTWTNADGDMNGAWNNDTFAVFQGAPGIVNVNNGRGTQRIAGMQFMVDGYRITGGTINLIDTESVIRVGDGTAAGEGMTAVIQSPLWGAGKLVKSDLGTLVLAGANGYGGGTHIEAGTLRVDADSRLGSPGSRISFGNGVLHTTDSFSLGYRPIRLDGTGTFRTDAGTTLTIGEYIAGDGMLVKSGAGTLILAQTFDSHKGGTRIEEGTLQLGNGGASGVLAGDVENNGRLVFNRSDAYSFDGAITGTGAVEIAGGTVILTSDSDHEGGTTIAAGATLHLDGGWIAGDVDNDGALIFENAVDRVFAGAITGDGEISMLGDGVLTLTADNSYKGQTTVASGTLIVNGDQSLATGETVVERAGGITGTLGGAGVIGGDVVVQGALAPGEAGATTGTLTIKGDLTFTPDAEFFYDIAAHKSGTATHDLVHVDGALLLDGTVHVNTMGDSIGPGVHRMLTYGGALLGDSVIMGSVPAGMDLALQLGIEGQVNLVNATDHDVVFWDGAGALNGGIDGGSGIWSTAAQTWTDKDGTVQDFFTDGAFAVFQGAGGTVDAEGTQNVAGMQFAVDGYEITGDAIRLVGTEAVIRVGDGTAAGASMTATIAAPLIGDATLVKTDAGTLTLRGANGYTGGTVIRGGTLQVENDANLGHASGKLVIDGGALVSAGDLAIGRAVMFGDDGVIDTGSFALTLGGTLSGPGNMVKKGAGRLVLQGTGDLDGDMNVAEGTLLVAGDYAGMTGTIAVASGATLAGDGVFGGDVVVASGGRVQPGSADGRAGTLTVGGDFVLSSGSVLDFRFGEADVAGGGLNDLVEVGGDLVLAGMLNVQENPDGGSFGPGVYTLFTYGGKLHHDPADIAFGATPAGSDLSLRTSVKGKVLLVNSVGLVFSYWDGIGGDRHDGIASGGDGMWSLNPADSSWMDGSHPVNGSFTNGTFTVFDGAPGTVTVNNSHGAVATAGMQFRVNGYTITGDALTLSGPIADIHVGDGTAAGANMTATIAASLAGNAQLAKVGAGTLVLSGINTYTGGTSVEGGVLAVSSDANLGDAAGGVTLAGGTLRILGDVKSGRDVTLATNSAIAVDKGATASFSGKLTGAGRLEKKGDGALDLAGDSSGFTGTALISGGLLAINGNFGGAVEVVAGGRVGGSGRIGKIVNSGVIAPGNSIGTLRIPGDYVGAGGTVEIEAVLGGDNSPTDLLVVEGNTSGSSFVRVINLGGAGAATQEGIRIIDVEGKSEGSFTLIGDYTLNGEPVVVAGAYGYLLHKNGISTPEDGDWYLRSTRLEDPADPRDPTDPADPGDPTPLFQPGVPVHEGYAQVLHALGGLSTLRERAGGRLWSDAETAGHWGIWGRVDAASRRPEAHVSTTGADLDVNSWQVQMGLEAELHRGNTGMLTGGLAVHYGEADANVVSAFGAGSIDARGYGLGASVTWYGAQGVYADAQLQLTLFDSDLRSNVLGLLKRGNDAMGEAVGIEIGQRIAIGGKFAVTPQAQVTYAHMDFDMFRDSVDAEVSLSESSSLKTRLGVALDHESAWERNDDLRRSSLYGIVNLSYEWEDGSVVNVSGTQITRRDRRLWGELGHARAAWARSRAVDRPSPAASYCPSVVPKLTWSVAMDEQAKKTALRMIPYGIYVLTAGSKDGNVAAATVNWVTQTSFAPPLLALGVKTDSGVYALGREKGQMVLNMLGKGQQGPAFTFFKPAEYADGKLSGEPVKWAANGAPILENAPAAVELKLLQVVELGDHHTFIAEVTGVHLNKPIEGRPDDAVLHMKDLGEKVFYGG